MQAAISRGLKYLQKLCQTIDFMQRSYESYKRVFEDYHGILSPCSTGVADKGLKSTGSADFNKFGLIWGAKYFTSFTSGENNLPLGVQLIGDKYDLRFLGIANWLEK